ncbi:hypothetical protein DID80_03810 [Candidatus Marinamargulisbacteria bacterium SCGC AAA071-K20]|nr:hypothetical protein DID80_03810 [Candidatus Marinamargulisbacteria bacterium SCGC AAA071-K20]
MFKQFLIATLLLSLSLSAMQTKSVGESSVTLISPSPYEVMTKGKILFKGRVNHIKSIEINGVKVPIKKSKFYTVLELQNQGDYHNYEVTALTKSGEKIMFSRNIFWLDKPLQEKNITEKRDHIQKASLDLGWTPLSLNNEFIHNINRDFPEAAKRFELPVNVNHVYVEKQSQFMLNRALVLYKNQELVMVIPWATRLTHLTLFSQFFAKSLFQNGVFNINSVTIFFYNKKMDILELYYPSLAQLPAPKWVLNDKVVKKPGQKQGKELIKDFIREHFVAY